MERLRIRPLTQRAAAGLAAAAVALAAGCVTTQGKTTAAKPPNIPPPDAGVVTAGALAPAAVPAAPAAAPAGSGMPQLPSFLGGAKPTPPPAEMVTMWRNKIDQLPDPSRHGRLVPGLAGQMFLFGPTMHPADANGTLTIDLFDETPRQPGAGPPALLPERWQFDRDTLRKLVSGDERWGRGYVLFLPWPNYRPDVNRVRVMARFDPDGGHPLYTQPSVVTINPADGAGLPPFPGPAVPNVPANLLPQPQPVPAGQPVAAGWPATPGVVPVSAGVPQPLPPSVAGGPQAWQPTPYPQFPPATPVVTPVAAPYPQPGMPMMPVTGAARPAAWSPNPLAPNGIAVPGMNPAGGAVGQGVMVINRQGQAQPPGPVQPAGYR